VKVILLAPVSSAAASVIGPAASAKQTPVIAYGQLARFGFASYLVGFDDFNIGQMQANALAGCLRAAKTYSRHPLITQITGPPDDINAQLVARGFRDVVDPLFDKGTYVKGPIASASTWSSTAGRASFLRTLAKSGNRVGGVMATNDQFAGEVISVLNARRHAAIPVTGQDATFASMQNIVDREQCVTILKPIRWQADAATKLAASLVRREDPAGLNGKVADGDQDVPAVLVPAVPITKRNYFLMFTEGIYQQRDVCNTPARLRLCFQ
jgi:D-xylose transport system substrate-binding protein